MHFLLIQRQVAVTVRSQGVPTPNEIYNPSSVFWVYPEPPMSWTYPEDLQGKVLRRHSDQMPVPPQLALFDTKEQWLYSELPPDVWAPHSISKAGPSHPMEETQFCHLYLWFHSFSHYPKLMTIGQGWNVDRLVRWKLWHLAQLSLDHNGLVQLSRYYFYPFYPHSWTRPRDSWTPSLGAVIHSQPRGSNPLFSSREPRSQNCRCWLSSQLLQTRLKTTTVHVEGHSLMKPMEPHHLQTAEMQFWGPQTGHSPPPSSALRSCPWISQTELETRGNPGRRQHSPKKCTGLYAENMDTALILVISTRWLGATAPVPQTPAEPPTEPPAEHT